MLSRMLTYDRSVSNRLPRTRPGRIFVSRLRADEAWASWISRVLADEGVEVLSVSEAEFGEPVAASLARAVASADEVWVVQSRAAKASPNIATEVAEARGAGIPVMFVLVDDEAGLADIEEAPVLDLRSGSLRRRESRLVAAVGRSTPRPTLAEGDADTPAGSLGLAQQGPLSLRALYPPPAVPRELSIGRPRIAAQLNHALFKEGSSVALAGRAASGKTHAAAKFVYENRWRFTEVAWLRGESWTSALPAIRERSSRLTGESNVEGADSPERPDDRLLVVIDDITVESQVRDLAGLPLRVDVLLTTRLALPSLQLSGRDFVIIHVDYTLAQDEAMELAAHAYPSLAVTDVERMVDVSRGDVFVLSVLLRAASESSESDALRVFDVLQRIEANSGGQYFLDTADPRLIADWERSFQSLGGSDDEVELADFEPGSWTRRWQRRYSTERVEELLDSAERAAEVAALGRPEADANRNNAEAIARLIEASIAIPNLVIVSGSVLLVKVTDDRGARIVSKTLTATQLRAFEANERLSTSPADALEFLTGANDGSTELPGPR